MKTVKKVFVAIIISGILAIVVVLSIVKTALGDVSLVASAIGGNVNAITQLSLLVANAFSGSSIGGTACISQDAPSLTAPGNAPDTATLTDAIHIDAAGDNRLEVSMNYGALAASGGNAKQILGDKYGPYGIPDPGSGENYGITIEQALSPADATNYEVTKYKNAMQVIDPTEWPKNPERAAAAVAYIANQAKKHYPDSLGTAKSHQLYLQSVAILTKLGISTDFKTVPSTGGSSTPSLSGLNPKNVPEPMRSQIIAAAKQYNVAPAAIAALYITEQNGFSLEYAYYDKNKDLSVFSGLSPPSSEWRLDVYGSSGEWPQTSTTFRGPFQFGPVWESTYQTPQHPDVYKFADAVYGAAHYMADLGATIDKGLDGIRQAARNYNGQTSFDIGGGIRNPDPAKFQLVRDLYADQVVNIVQGIDGGSSFTTSPTCASGTDTTDNGGLPIGGLVGIATLQRQSVIIAAHGQLGLPYSYGGGLSTPPFSPSRGLCSSDSNDLGANDCNVVGLDCSGYTEYSVWAALHIDVGETANAQWQKLSAHRVTQAQALPGDLVFFVGADGSSDTPGHVGIYLGGGRMYAEPESGEVAREQALQSDLIGFADEFAYAAQGGK